MPQFDLFDKKIQQNKPCFLAVVIIGIERGKFHNLHP
jgi:hypothetical protein